MATIKNDAGKMDFFGLLSMGVGNIIGSGVFTMLPAVIGMTGRSVSFAMLFGAIVCIIYMIPTLFLSSVVNLRGGAYSQHLALFPRGVAGVFGIVQTVAYLGFASYGIGLASYTLQLFPGLESLQKIVAMAYLVAFFLLGVKGIKTSSGAQKIMVVVLFVALGIYIFGGLPHVQAGYFSQDGFFTGGVSGFLSAAALLCMSSMGATTLISFSSVCKNPKRDIPLAMACSTGVVAIFYFLAAVVTSGIVPIELVAGKNLGVVAETFMAQPIYLFFMIGGALFALGTSLNATLSAQAYPWMKMAEDGWLPKILLKKDAKFSYPFVLMGIIFLLGAIFPIVFGMNISTITSLFAFPSFVVTTIAAIATMRIPKLYPKEWATSAFHVPTPVLYTLLGLATCASAYLAIFYMRNLTTKTLILAIAVLLLLVLYVTWRYKAGYISIDTKELTEDSEDK